MTDKEVGKWWVAINEDCGKGETCDNHGVIFKLIRKLVEDETEMLERLVTLGCYPKSFDAKRAVLVKFGIDLKDWKE